MKEIEIQITTYAAYFCERLYLDASIEKSVKVEKLKKQACNRSMMKSYKRRRQMVLITYNIIHGVKIF